MPEHQQFESLVTAVVERLQGTPGRFLLGVTGCPGAGKSTLAAHLEQAVNERLSHEVSIVVPMDGYHLSNERLTELGLLPLKGIPATFDAYAFTQLLHQLKLNQTPIVFAPRFDRSIEASIENAIAIKPEHRLCIVEGNYLLLDEPPWNECRNHLDEVWFLDVPMDVLLPRLIERHQVGGKTAEAARAKVDSTDLPNARLIAGTKDKATRIIQ